ncbi:MAG TPA: N-acetylglucosamine-6-phosphate deacetylase, partial [Bacillota bacterium]|nr:N-acetylglucosamine-6-phosphate deacetylase [Bacillota bacterium]
MCNYYFRNAECFVNGHLVKASVTVIDGRIDSVNTPNTHDLPEKDLAGLLLLPGFIDPHTHGGYGIDCNSASADDFIRLCGEFAKTGTTAWLCSVSADTKERTIH